MTTFGDIRSLAHQAPSRENFQRLLETLHTAQTPREQFEAEWMPYLEGHLSDWPEDTRACGGELVRVLETEQVPWSGLVHTLDYNDAHLSKSRVHALANAAHLAHVSRLDLRASRITWPLLGELVASAPFTRLRSFAMRKSNSSGVDAQVFEALMRSPMLSALEELHIDGWARITGKYLKTILDHLPLTGLRALDISRTKASAKALKALFQCEELTELRALHVRELPITLQDIFAATHLESLEHLDMGQPHWISLDEESAIPAHIQRLKTWGLEHCLQNPAAYRRLVSPDAYPRLESLDLSNNPMEGDSLGTLARATCFPELRELCLEGSSIDDLSLLEGMAHYPSLRRLNLKHARLAPGHWEAVSRAPVFHQLEHLNALFHQNSRSPSSSHEVFETPLPENLKSLCALVRGDAELLAMLEALPTSSELESLKLHCPSGRREILSDAALDQFITHASASEVRELHLRNHGTSPDHAVRLLEGLPKLERLEITSVDDRSIFRDAIAQGRARDIVVWVTR